VLATIAPILGDVLTNRKAVARYTLDVNYGAMNLLNISKMRNHLNQYAKKAHLVATVTRRLQLPVSLDPK
jgi:hypothetical protein